MGRDPGDDLAVVSVDSEGDTHNPAVPTGGLKAIGRPAMVRGSLNDAALLRWNGTPTGRPA
jgi:hypothetical protein